MIMIRLSLSNNSCTYYLLYSQNIAQLSQLFKIFLFILDIIVSKIKKTRHTFILFNLIQPPIKIGGNYFCMRRFNAQ